MHQPFLFAFGLLSLALVVAHLPFWFLYLLVLLVVHLGFLTSSLFAFTICAEAFAAGLGRQEPPWYIGAARGLFALIVFAPSPAARKAEEAALL